MMLDAQCAECGQAYRLPAEMAGRRAKCKTCGASMQLPDVQEIMTAPSSPPPPPKRVAKPPLQSFGAPTKPPLQSFGASPGPASAPARRPAAAPSRPGPIMDFEEVTDDEGDRFEVVEDGESDPYGLDDLPAPPRTTKPAGGSYDDDDAIDEGRAAPPRAGRPGKAKKARKIVAAGMGRRFMASFVDGFIIFALQVLYGFACGFCVGFYLAFSKGHAPKPEDLAGPTQFIQFTSLLVGILYGASMISGGNQATIGKRMMGMRVVGNDGRPIGFGMALVREAAKILSALLFLIGYIMAFFTKDHQALHDMMAGTVVVEG